MSCRVPHIAINTMKIRYGVPKDDLFQILNRALLDYITFININENFKLLF